MVRQERVIIGFVGFFFFQAEDGIRDKLVTGVQTCALPIWIGEAHRVEHPARELRHPRRRVAVPRRERNRLGDDSAEPIEVHHPVELASEPRGAGGEKNRILEGVAEEVAGERRPGHYLLDRPATAGSRGPRPTLRSYSRRYATTASAMEAARFFCEARAVKSRASSGLV